MDNNILKMVLRALFFAFVQRNATNQLASLIIDGRMRNFLNLGVDVI